jgi:hypothetical protein
MEKTKIMEVTLGTVFKKEELCRALEELKRENKQISSINKNGIYVGTTRPRGKGVWAAYNQKGIFLNTLNFISQDNVTWTWEGRLDSIITSLFF